jgi:hypothetical protein
VTNEADTVNPRAFTPAELIDCSVCFRPNPPNRSNCLYCGSVLSGTAATAIALRKGERLQSEITAKDTSYIVVISIRSELNEAQFSKVAELTGSAESEIRRALQAARMAPLCSTRTAEDAEVICTELRSCDLDASIIAEQQLDLDSAPAELRALEMSEQALTAICQRGERRISANWTDVTLFVAGHLHFSKVEVEQKGKNKQSKIVAERRLSSDEAVLDIYLRKDEAPWRIKSSSFDFSCLGEQKTITAFENFATLTWVLRQHATQAQFNDDYVRLRPVLERVWPAEEDQQPTQRRRAGWREVEASVTHSSNEAEFNHYSGVVRFMSQSDAQ